MTALLAALMATLLLLGPVASGQTGPSAQAQETASDGGHERFVDMTFPLSGASYYSDTFDSPRSSGSHRATDIMADKMVPVHAAVGGTITLLRRDGDQYTSKSGSILQILGDDGFEYSYIHMNNDTPGTDDGQAEEQWMFAPGIEVGDRVERGQWISYVGDSGNAESTGAHLHFSINDENQSEEGGYINPFGSLVAAQDRGDVPDAPDESAGSGEGTSSGRPNAAAPPEGESVDGDGTTTDSPAPDAAEDADGSAGGATRLSGANRISTSVALSRAAWTGTSRAVIIVPAGSHVEALVAAALAGEISSPVLLSGPDGLSDEVTAEIERLGPDSAYVIGDTEQLSAQVEADLDDAGVLYRARLTAADRYALSTVVAREVADYGRETPSDPPVLDSVFLALGDADVSNRAWPDALSTSALAARTSTPVLLTDGQTLSDSVADLLTQFRPNTITVVGGTAAIRAAVAEEAAELANATVTRLSGSTRYGTSAAVADAARDAGLTSSEVWIATGLNFPDALAAGPAAARLRSPLLLVDGLSAEGSPQSLEWLVDNASAVVVVGGSAVVTDDVVAAVQAAATP